tara:strand:+ start:890 stop:1558 length:669 start_codon:yes stop_codon:yes gene_type:complete
MYISTVSMNAPLERVVLGVGIAASLGLSVVCAEGKGYDHLRTLMKNHKGTVTTPINDGEEFYFQEIGEQNRFRYQVPNTRSVLKVMDAQYLNKGDLNTSVGDLLCITIEERIGRFPRSYRLTWTYGENGKLKPPTIKDEVADKEFTPDTFEGLKDFEDYSLHTLERQLARPLEIELKPGKGVKPPKKIKKKDKDRKGKPALGRGLQFVRNYGGRQKIMHSRS